MRTGESSEEELRVLALQEKSGKNPAVQRDPVAIYLSTMGRSMQIFAFFPFAWNDGRQCTNADIHEAIVLHRDECHPLLTQARDQAIGSRREFWECAKNVYLHPACGVASLHGSEANADLMHAFSTAEWGADNGGLVDSLCVQSFDRHHVIG